MSEGTRTVSWTRYAVSAAILVLLAVGFTYFYGVRNIHFFLVPSESMVPTLLKRDYIITLNEAVYTRGDIVVLKDPESEGDFLVKRIVGGHGDTLSLLNGALYVNGKYASEPYIKEPIQEDMAPVEVPEGQFFVLGDNRNDSDDSLTWGHGVPAQDIIGRVRYIYSPISRMGPVRSYPLTNTAGE